MDATARLDPVRMLVEAAESDSDSLPSLLAERLAELSGDDFAAMHEFLGESLPPGVGGCVVAVWGETSLIAVVSERAPVLCLDGGEPLTMKRVAETPYWTALVTAEVGKLHTVRYGVDGDWAPAVDFAGYEPLSYELPETRRGTLLESRSISSEVYPGATTEYWIYVNPGVDQERGAPVMIWHDGAFCLEPFALFGSRMQIVTDNLCGVGAIPPMVHLLVNPSQGGEGKPVVFGERYAESMRAIQYCTFSDRYGRHLIDEVLGDAGRIVKLRRDGYSRGAAGVSSGGMSAFTLGWFHPEEVSRVHSAIGSFTDIHGGHAVPQVVRREPKRNIRVWLSSGMNDLEVDGTTEAGREIFEAGSQPLQNIALANALKGRGYDFHFRYGDGFHEGGQAALDLPESLTWLWRDYDAERTAQAYEQDPDERAQPVYRVAIANRGAW